MMTLASRHTTASIDLMQPLIGITARPQNVKSSGGRIASQLVPHTYIDSVRRAGGTPILLVPVEPSEVETLLDRLDGLVLTGGGDIEPEQYGAEPSTELRGTDGPRDVFEIELARMAYARRIPTLAICRGHQIVNVALGGTLIQQLSVDDDHDVWGDGVYEPHSIANVSEGSRIAGIIGAGPRGINSIHHQAIDQLGEGLRVVATAPDGTIEAVEHEDEHWDFLSVQWHPEYLGDRGHKESHELFASLVESAGKYAANS